jgi:hypothetical protein
MTPEKHGRGVEQAWQALEVWASVGVCRFDLTQTDLDGHKRSFQPALTLQVLRRCLPAWIESSIRRRQNFIVRPRGAMLVQLDDLRGPVLERLKGCAFLMLATSPGNHQAWIALQDYSPDFARNLRRGSGADPSASGATRLPDSINYKRKYAPDFPTVRLLQAVPCRIATRLELESLGLLADVDTMRLKSPARASSGRGTKRWPSYERCLAGAPKTHCGDGPDVSRADFTFCLISLDWGWSFEDAVGRLLEMSSKARENGERYARLTVARAATALHQRS